MFDVIIVGAGPAGLSAALLLGRCCRRVLICDTGTPRNGRSRALHGFLSRDRRLEEAGVAGLYVAGDASRDVQLAVVAAAEGVKAAFAINSAFQRERFEGGGE